MIRISMIFILFASPVLAAPDLLEKQGRTDYIESENSGDAGGKSLVFKNTLEFEKSINTLDDNNQSEICEAGLSVDYFQKESGLVVETLLTNYSCDASQGSYQIAVEYLDIDGTPRLFESQEPWAKQTDADFAGQHLYPIDFDVDIQKVRGRLLRKDGCVCLRAEVPAGDSE